MDMWEQGRAPTEGPQLRFFLSHSRVDGQEANSLADLLRHHFRSWGWDIQVFNTSEIEQRFPDLAQRLSGGSDWRSETLKHANELRRFLKDNLQNADVYLLLVTPRVESVSRAWVRWELRVADDLRSQLPGSRLIIPCLLGVDRFPEILLEPSPFQLEETGMTETDWAERLEQNYQWLHVNLDHPEQFLWNLEKVVHSAGLGR